MRSPLTSTPTEDWAERLVRFFAGPPGWLASAPATRVLIWLNVFVFAGQILYERRPSALMAMADHTVLAFGGNYAGTTLLEGHIENLIASCFVHGSLLHLFFNMFALRNAGPLVEYAVGPFRFAVMYLMAGAIGSALSAAWGYFTELEWLSVGASGAICGVLGAALVLGWRMQGLRGPLTRATFRWLGTLVLLGLLSTGTGFRIDNAAHFGGVLGGALQALLWRKRRPSVAFQQVALGVCALFLATTAWTVHLRSKRDPLVELRAADRFAYALEALEAGDCREAWRGIQGAKRLVWVPKLAQWRPHALAEETRRVVENQHRIQTAERAILRHCKELQETPASMPTASFSLSRKPIENNLAVHYKESIQTF